MTLAATDYETDGRVESSSNWGGDVSDYILRKLGVGLGTGFDDQNGLDDPSCWFEYVDGDIDPEEIHRELQDLGLELFYAPKDDPPQLFSSYGIPVDDPESLRSGDHIVVDKKTTFRVVGTKHVTDGGPWVSREGEMLFVRLSRTGPYNSVPRVLVKREDGVVLYREADSQPSGLASEGPVDSIYRAPRKSELAE